MYVFSLKPQYLMKPASLSFLLFFIIRSIYAQQSHEFQLHPELLFICLFGKFFRATSAAIDATESKLNKTKWLLFLSKQELVYILKLFSQYCCSPYIQMELRTCLNLSRGDERASSFCLPRRLGAGLVERKGWLDAVAFGGLMPGWEDM